MGEHAWWRMTRWGDGWCDGVKGDVMGWRVTWWLTWRGAGSVKAVDDSWESEAKMILQWGRETGERLSVTRKQYIINPVSNEKLIYRWIKKLATKGEDSPLNSCINCVYHSAQKPQSYKKKKKKAWKEKKQDNNKATNKMYWPSLTILHYYFYYQLLIELLPSL